MEPPKSLEFKISTGLKNVLGQDLIIDRVIAIYELVKNSYDAGATIVNICFHNINSEDNAKITISDNGCGMSLSDIQNKWLFVAYSEKKHFHDNNFRDQIPRRIPAWAKGVGRFSCDRLGAMLKLRTKTKDSEIWNQITVNWDNFDRDDSRNFESITIPYSFENATEIDTPRSGTILSISNLREKWDRKSILDMKKSLMKLINPDFNQDGDQFSIRLICQEEGENDKKQSSPREKINGIIVNDLFERLNIKTTSLIVKISEDGKEISTQLSDRGNYIFEIVERNRYFPELENIIFTIFYLNRSAKIDFRQIMGIPPVQYGSVFIYKNGFRVQPFGQPGVDSFKIDLRKSQGRNRYLGTRDIIGRIQILGDNPGFIETTSRDRGFLETIQYRQFVNFFIEKVIKVLEKYVIGLIHWGDPTRDEWAEGKTQGLQATDVLDKIIKAFPQDSRNDDIIKITYGDSVDEYLRNIQGMNISSTIDRLESALHEDSNNEVASLIGKIKEETNILKKQHYETEQEFARKEHELSLSNKQLHDKEKQINFLSNQVNADVKNLQLGYHIIMTHTSSFGRSIKPLIKYLKSESGKFDKKLLNGISTLVLINQRIKNIATFSLYGKLENPTDFITANIYRFIEQYINMSRPEKSKISITIDSLNISDINNYVCKFSPISFSLIIDNVISNSMKKQASNLNIKFVDYETYFEIHFADDGRGLDPQVKDIQELFNFGYTTSEEGSGLGLYHIKKITTEMKASVSVNTSYTLGYDLYIRIDK
jgi:signal transduction histidine kinase